MTHTMADHDPQSTAILTAYGRDGGEIEQVTLPLLDYYDNLHQLIDDEKYRNRKGIVLVAGRLIDSKHRVVQEFENVYGPAGEYVSGWARYEDGTITSD